MPQVAWNYFFQGAFRQKMLSKWVVSRNGAELASAWVPDDRLIPGGIILHLGATQDKEGLLEGTLNLIALETPQKTPYIVPLYLSSLKGPL